MEIDYNMYVRKDIQKFIDNGLVGPLFKGVHNLASLQVLTIDRPVKPLVIQNLISELRVYTFVEKISEFFQYEQSFDFRNFDTESHKPMCVTLHSIFENDLKKVVEKLFDLKLDGEVSMTASKYAYKDFLLCHDDQVEDRAVAFILYLEDWEKEYGGTLDFFDHDEDGEPKEVVLSILPKANQLVLFKVDDFSHHQVAEVFSKEKPRLAVSGWFHKGEGQHNKKKAKLMNDPAPNFKPVLIEHPLLNFAFMNDYEDLIEQGLSFFVTNSLDLQNEIVENRCVSLEHFLKKDFYEAVLEELISDKIGWFPVGSAMRRRYQVAAMEDRTVANCPVISKLLGHLQGTNFLKLLSMFIMKKLNDAHERDISVATEVIKFRKGDYMMMVNDQRMYNSKSSIDVWLLFDCNHINSSMGGELGYFETKERLTMSLTPRSNSAFIVARTKEILPFMSYINNDVGNKVHYAVYMRYSLRYKPKELRGEILRPAVIRRTVDKEHVLEVVQKVMVREPPTDSDSDEEAIPEKRARF